MTTSTRTRGEALANLASDALADFVELRARSLRQFADAQRSRMWAHQHAAGFGARLRAEYEFASTLADTMRSERSESVERLRELLQDAMTTASDSVGSDPLAQR